MVENIDIAGNVGRVGQYLNNGLKKLKQRFHFITDVRKEFEAPGLPFIVGILGVYGTDPDSRKFDRL